MCVATMIHHITDVKYQNIPTPKIEKGERGGHRPRRAAEAFVDEFWREGEVALLFGSHGVGKIRMLR